MGGRKNRSHSLPVSVDCCQALTYRKREITVSGDFTSLSKKREITRYPAGMSKNQVTLQMFRLGERLTDAKFGSLFLCNANVSISRSHFRHAFKRFINIHTIFTPGFR